MSISSGHSEIDDNRGVDMTITRIYKKIERSEIVLLKQYLTRSILSSSISYKMTIIYAYIQYNRQYKKKGYIIKHNMFTEISIMSLHSKPFIHVTYLAPMWL